MMIMKKFFLCCSFGLIAYSCTSCYAYFKAERMVYQGTLAKGSNAVELTGDSTTTSYAVK